MAEPEVEAAWRAEFKRIGETQVRDALNSITDEPKRQAAFRWLGDEAEARRLREEQTHHYVRWTFFAAVAASTGLVPWSLKWPCLALAQRTPLVRFSWLGSLLACC